MNRKIYKLISSLTHTPKNLKAFKTYIIIEGEKMRKIVILYPKEDRDGLYGFRIEVRVIDEVTLHEQPNMQVVARLVEDASTDILLREAERTEAVLKDLISNVEKKFEESKSNLNHIIETIKKIASGTGYDLRFIREDDP